FFFFFFSSRRRHTRFSRDWSSDVCSSDLEGHKLYHQKERRQLIGRHTKFFAAKLGAERNDRLDAVVVEQVSHQEEHSLRISGQRSEERRVGKERRYRGSQ